MPQSDPTRSDYCATRHLLRHLSNARALRRNPLTRDDFASCSEGHALSVIGARVDKALAQIDKGRQVAILIRVDVERHVPSQVASDLGVSMRQFFRERRIAHDAFASAYRMAARPLTVEVREDFAARILQHAGALADSGELLSARAILEGAVRSGGDLEARCEALIRLAHADAWAHRFAGARDHLRAADRLLSEPSLREAAREKLRDARDAVALSLRWFSEGPSAVNGAERFFAREGPRTTFVRAAAALRNGESTRASVLLSRIDLSRDGFAEPETIVDCITLQGEMADFTPEHFQVSEELFERAIALARVHGLGGRALYAEHQLRLTRWMHSRSPSDRHAYRALVDRMDRSLPPRLRSYLTFSAADVELAIGNSRRTLEASRLAEAVSTNAYETLSAQGFAAGALLRLGRVSEAATQARLAADAAGANLPRVVALGRRISAQAHYVRGDRRAAREAIEEAIELARNFSSAYVVLQAQAIRDRILHMRR